jgi:hypothetical protein
MTEDELGDKLKQLEQQEAGRKADPFLPLMAESEIEYYALQRWIENQYNIIEEVEPPEQPEHFYP